MTTPLRPAISPARNRLEGRTIASSKLPAWLFGLKGERVTESLRSYPTRKPLLTLLILAVCVRLIGSAFPPNIYNDTDGYVHLAERFLALRLAGYNGLSTPVYPLLLALTGLNFQVVKYLQYLLGIGISVTLFRMFFRRTHNATLALVAGVVFCLNVGELAFEQAILTETLATFLLSLSAFRLQHVLSDEHVPWTEYALLGTLVGLTALTRPLYIYLAPLYFVFLVTRPGLAPVRSIHLAAFAGSAGALLLGWSFVNWWNVGYFSISTQMGFGLTNQSGAFIELAPDEYAAIRDPYLKARAKQIAKTGTHTNTIYRAWDDIKRETGYDDIHLLREVTRMSLQLFVAHPILYAHGVARSWLRFWVPPLSVGMPFLGGHLKGISHGPRLLAVLGRTARTIQAKEILPLMAFNLIFLFFAASTIVQFLRRRLTLGFDQFAIAIVVTASIVQAMVEFGGNGRFAVPTFPLVIYTVIVGFWSLSSIRGRLWQSLKLAQPWR